MKSDRNIEKDIQNRAKDTVGGDGPFIDLNRQGSWEVETVEDYGDFEFYADELIKRKNSSKSAVAVLRAVKNKLEEFSDNPTEVSAEEALKFKIWLEKKHKPKTVQTYISRLNKMADFYVSHGYYEGNPFRDLTESIDTNTDRATSFQSSDRITVPNNELRVAIKEAHGSVKIVLIALLIKTGARVSEICNLDWEDIHIDQEQTDKLFPSPRTELVEHPDTLFIDPSKGDDEYETATNGNKRKVNTHIPIDNELKKLFQWYRIVQPLNFGSNNPVLRTNHFSQTGAGNRMSTSAAHNLVTNWASEYTWYESGRDQKENLTPHWFRAKFSTYMINRLRKIEDDEFNEDPKDLTKGLRGDVGQDVIEDYIMRYEFYSEYIRPRQFKIGIQ